MPNKLRGFHPFGGGYRATGANKPLIQLPKGQSGESKTKVETLTPCSECKNYLHQKLVV